MVAPSVKDSRPKSLEARIQRHYSRLPDSERRIADVILDFPGELAAYSATELAGLAGVSKAAASRLFKRLGFENFEEARRLVRDAKDWGSPLYLHQKEVTAPDPRRELQDIAARHASAINLTLGRLEPVSLSEAIDALLAARRIWTVGFRNSHFMAAYARFQLLQIRRNVLLLPCPGETLGEYAAEFEAGDLLLAVALRRRVPRLQRILEAARQASMPIIAITDVTAIGIQRLADWSFLCELDSHHLFDTYAGPIALIHYMSVLAMRKAGKSGRCRLEAVELQHEYLAEFE